MPEELKYEKLEKQLRNLPMAWYPALIRVMIEVAIGKKVFIEVKAHEYVKRIEDKVNQK